MGGSLQRVLGRLHAIPPRVVKRTSHCSREFKKGDKDRATLISLRSFDKDDEGEHTPP